MSLSVSVSQIAMENRQWKTAAKAQRPIAIRDADSDTDSDSDNSH
jgi:hypothetical protein